MLAQNHSAQRRVEIIRLLARDQPGEIMEKNRIVRIEENDTKPTEKSFYLASYMIENQKEALQGYLIGNLNQPPQ